MKTWIPERLRELVSNRANSRCEYCLLHQNGEPVYPHEIDHVIAEKHSGPTTAYNLAFACFYCNRFKGTDIASIDPLTDEIVPSSTHVHNNGVDISSSMVRSLFR